MALRSRLPNLITIAAMLAVALAAALGTGAPVPIASARPLADSYYTAFLGTFGNRISNGGWAQYDLDVTGWNGAALQAVYIKYISNAGPATTWAGTGDALNGQPSPVWNNGGTGTEAMGSDWCIYVSGTDVTSTCDAGKNAAGASSYSHQSAIFHTDNHFLRIRLDHWANVPDTVDFVNLQVWAVYYGTPPTAGPTDTPSATATPGPTNTPNVTSSFPTGTPTDAGTATPTSGVIIGPTPTLGPTGPCDPAYAENYLCNGNFELPAFLTPGQTPPPDWTFWGGGPVDQNSTNSGGLAYCGTQFANISGNGMTQRVYLPPGVIQFHYRIRRKAEDFNGLSYPQIEIDGIGGRYTAEQWIVRDGKNGESLGSSGRFTDFGWVTVEESHVFLVTEPGFYDVSFSNIAYTPAESIVNNLGTPVIIGPFWGIQNDPAQDYQVDDVWLGSTGYKSYCPGGPGGPTATPRQTKTPTAPPSLTPSATGPTPTPTRTPTAGGPTPTPNSVNGFANCDFENGLSGWTGQVNATVLLAGGPVGPQFARIVGFNGQISQEFQWDGGQAFFTFWVGSGSGGSIHLVRIFGNYDVVLWAENETSPSWKLIQETILYVAPGTYYLQVRGNNFNFMDVDGMLPSANGYQYCNTGNTAVTPTAGPTSFVTPTSTKTPTPGPSRVPPTVTPRPTVPTHTPNATWTPSSTPGNGATSTAQSGTATAQSHTATAQASFTPATATHTPTPGNGTTATAQASVTPATGTPAATYSATVPPTSTPIENPTPQPEAAPGADCQRPDSPLKLAGWIEFEVCQVETWVLWTPDNSTQVLNIQATMQAYEPLGTLNEMTDARNQLQAEINRFDWANTGLQSGALPDVSIFFPSTTPNGILTGNLVLTPNPNAPLAFVRTCSVQVANVFGDAMGQGMCAAINWMVATGILNWVQYFFDVAIWFAFLRYVWHTLTVTLPQIL